MTDPQSKENQSIATTQVPESECPVCSNKLDAASDIQSDAVPSPGDATVCIICASFLTFTETMHLRLMSLEEISVLPDDVRLTLQRYRRVVQKIRAEH